MKITNFLRNRFATFKQDLSSRWRSLQNLRLVKVDIWSSRRPKVRSRYFLSADLLFGGVNEAHLKDFLKARLLARIDLWSGQLHDLQTGELKTVDEGQAFEIEDQIFQYRVIRPSFKWALIPAGGLLILIGAQVTHHFQKVEICSGLPLYVSSGNWNEHLEDPREQEFLQTLLHLRKNFRESLRDGDLITSRTRLEEIRAKLAEMDWPRACHRNEVFSKLHSQFSQKVIAKFQKEENYLAAAEEMIRWEESIGSVLFKERHKLHRSLRRAFLKAYRNEGRDPESSEIIFEKVGEACRALGEDEFCYRRPRLFEASSPQN